jgi:CheY-like chemotaxis protein
VDDDRDIAEIVQAVLVDEGYSVTLLYDLEDDALLRTVGRFEPDCVLLDSSTSAAYGASWATAASLALRERAIPVVMFTAHTLDAAEAREGVSSRAKAADFVAVLEKPFSLDELLAAVAKGTGGSTPFDREREAETQRTESLVQALAQRGATEIEPSTMREWATFRDKRGRLCQLYWWQGRGVYQLGRYTERGQMAMVGQFVTRQLAIEAALPS